MEGPISALLLSIVSLTIGYYRGYYRGYTAGIEYAIKQMDVLK